MTSFIIPNEGHTMGNLIRYELLKNENILVAAYKVTHPLKEELQIYIKTTEEINCKDAIKKSIQDLINKTKYLEKQIN